MDVLLTSVLEEGTACGAPFVLGDMYLSLSGTLKKSELWPTQEFVAEDDKAGHGDDTGGVEMGRWTEPDVDELEEGACTRRLGAQFEHHQRENGQRHRPRRRVDHNQRHAVLQHKYDKQQLLTSLSRASVRENRLGQSKLVPSRLCYLILMPCWQ